MRSDPSAQFNCSKSIVVVQHYHVHVIAAGSLEIELASAWSQELVEASSDSLLGRPPQQSG